MIRNAACSDDPHFRISKIFAVFADLDLWTLPLLLVEKCVVVVVADYLLTDREFAFCQVCWKVFVPKVQSGQREVKTALAATRLKTTRNWSTRNCNFNL